MKGGSVSLRTMGVVAVGRDPGGARTTSFHAGIY